MPNSWVKYRRCKTGLLNLGSSALVTICVSLTKIVCLGNYAPSRLSCLIRVCDRLANAASVDGKGVTRSGADL